MEHTDGQISHPGISGWSHPTAVLGAASAVPQMRLQLIFWHEEGLQRGWHASLGLSHEPGMLYGMTLSRAQSLSLRYLEKPNRRAPPWGGAACALCKLTSCQ